MAVAELRDPDAPYLILRLHLINDVDMRGTSSTPTSRVHMPRQHTRLGRPALFSTPGYCADAPLVLCPRCLSAPVFTDDFVVAGTCADNLYGTCESLFQKDMSPDQLFETMSQALLAAMDRDALSGWGAEVKIMYVPSQSVPWPPPVSRRSRHQRPPHARVHPWPVHPPAGSPVLRAPRPSTLQHAGRGDNQAAERAHGLELRPW